MKPFFSYNQQELEEYLNANLNIPKFRARQAFCGVYKQFATSFDEINVLPKTAQLELKKNFCIYDIEFVKKYISKDSSAIKYLFKLKDGLFVEAVRLKYKHGLSLCISTQVGCRRGCSFCASGIGGLVRNLEAYEMLSQIGIVSALERERISHVVLMGIGEPLDNFDEVVKFLENVQKPEGFGISHRKITVSTCGVVPRIDSLAKQKLQITLAVSLHNPFNDERSKIMPVNREYPIEDLIKAIDNYIEITSRRVSIEYAMLKDINDSDRHLEKLISLLRGKKIHINLIPIHPIKERNFRAAHMKRIREFQDLIIKEKIPCTIRKSLGEDIQGACGQLRRTASNIENHSN